MADVAEERGLGAIDLGQRFGAPAFLLVGARAGQADGNLFRDAADEVTVGVVERAARMDAEHEETGRLAGLAQPDRYHRRLLGGNGQPGIDSAAARSPRSTSRQSSASAVLNRQTLSPLQSMTAGCQESSVSTLTPARQGLLFVWQILVEKCEGALERLSLSVSALTRHTSSSCRASAVREATSRSTCRRRSSITRSVMSKALVSTPPTGRCRPESGCTKTRSSTPPGSSCGET